MEDFELFWDLYKPEDEFINRRNATCRLWHERSETDRQAMIAELQQHGAPKHRNPYFYVQDFRIRPAARQQTLSFAEYYNRYGTTEETDGWKRVFEADKQRTIYVK